MYSIDKNSYFWHYISDGQRDLIEEGQYLITLITRNSNEVIKDYSFLVFPFAKAYEGFLKQIFRDAGFITLHEYESDHFRIGRALNPSLEKQIRYQSVYDKIVYKAKKRELADGLWTSWKKGRNLLFHYFPHNLKAISLIEAEELIDSMLTVMEKAVRELKIKNQGIASVDTSQ